MPREKDIKVSLSPDQFSINEKGELVIREAEILKILQQQQQQNKNTPVQDLAAKGDIAVVVGVSRSF